MPSGPPRPHTYRTRSYYTLIAKLYSQNFPGIFLADGNLILESDRGVLVSSQGGVSRLRGVTLDITSSNNSNIRRI
jgi:hypothetical protein